MIYLKDEARQILTDKRLATIGECIESAYRSIEQLPAEITVSWCDRTKANHVRDLAIQKLRMAFSADSGVKPFQQKGPNGLILFIIDGKIVLRVKKLSDGLRSSNHKTKQSQALQEQDLGMIPDLGDGLTVVNAGYTENILRNGIQHVRVVCSKKHKDSNKEDWYWVIDITPGGMQETEHQQIPFAPTPEITPKRRFKPKTRDNDQAQANE